jgi:hypothetical protein
VALALAAAGKLGVAARIAWPKTLQGCHAHATLETLKYETLFWRNSVQWSVKTAVVVWNHCTFRHDTRSMTRQEKSRFSNIQIKE